MMRAEKNNMGENDEKISLSDLAEILSVYGNISRLEIIKQLKRTSSEFSDLKEITKLSKTALAHHLEKLTKLGVIEKTSRGKYKLTEDGLEFYSAVVDSYALSQRRINFDNKNRADHIQEFFSGKKKNELAVTFERLLPMRVVSFQAISNSPEQDAMIKLREWAEPKGLFADSIKHPIYGFNNPCPKPGKSEYGYEFWIQVDADFHEEGVKIKDVPEFFCVVSRCYVTDPYKDIPATWTKMLDWIKENNYEFGSMCGLEKIISSSQSDEWILDIYIPLKEESVKKK